ncbi:MAG TPA: glycosyltransferase family A protein [Solirubrobacteraceae bacterium]|jgi:glycosyltransferase involved in cell wall biosynthesis
MPSEPAVSVIVAARDAEPTLPRTLRALAGQQVDGAHEVIVVDDGSRDRTAQLAMQAGGPVRVIRQPPLGPAAARNRGVSEAGGSRLAFCDADVFPAPGWLQAGIDALRVADLVQGRVVPDPEAVLGPFDRTLWINSQVGLWETANLFVTRAAFEAAGGFEEWISPARGKALAEDVWFGYRALRAGARPAFCPAALAHHAVFPRAWPGYVAERVRLRFFPAMAAKMPELRDAFLYRRWFLNRRTARLDVALAAGLVAAARRSPVPLVAALPYARTVRRQARRGSPGLGVAVADVAGDLVGFAALAAGSLRHRAAVL